MAEVKNYGLSGVHHTLQLGKQGPVLVGNADTDSFSVTLQDAATLTTMGGANATSGTHFITKSQLDAVYTEATFLANVNYNDSSPILLGNISYGTKTIITTFEVSTAFDANAVVTVGDASDNNLLMSDNYAEVEVAGTYQTINTIEFADDSTLNIYVTQGGATQGAGTILVSVVDGPVVNAGAVNYGSGSSGIALADLSVTSNSPSGNGSLSYNNTTGVFTFTPPSGAEGDPAYKGFKAHYGRMYNNNSDPNGPINKIVIYKETATPGSTIDTSTGDDTFTVTGLTGSDVVVMLVAIGENINQTTTAELKTFAESIIDNVILDGGVEGQVNTAADMKTAFYATFATFSATLTDLKAELDFFGSPSTPQYNINYFTYNGSTGSGASFISLQYSFANSGFQIGSWSNGAGYVVGDTFTILGTDIGDVSAGQPLASPANDTVITVASVHDGGYLNTFTIASGISVPADPGPNWPSNNIGDGGDDEYDTGNYINTNLDTEISYNSGNVVSGSSAFGGGDYVVTYQDSIFGVFAVNADISSIGTSGNSGFDGDGQADTGSLYGAAEAGVNIGNFIFSGDVLTINTDDTEDLKLQSPDDLYLDALGDDVHIRADDDVRIKVGYNFANDTAQSQWLFTNGGSITFPNGSTQSTAWTGSVDYNNVNNTPTIPADISDLTDTTNLLGGSAGNYGNSNVVTLLSSFGSNTIFTSGNVTTGILRSTATIFGNVDIVLGDTANASVAKTRLVSFGASSYIQTGNGTTGSTGNIVFSPYLAADQRVVINTASGNITASGNVTANNFIGNISITGNVVGTSQNVSLVAGSFTTTIDNTGNLVLPGNTFAVKYANGTQVDVVTRVEGTWTVPTGNSTQSFTVPAGNTYYMWVEGNIPNGIITWNATASITNTNVPVVGAQYAWVYTGGGSPIDFTSIPSQFVGTANTIVRSFGIGVTNTNVFAFGINNISGSTQVVRYGWVQIS